MTTSPSNRIAACLTFTIIVSSMLSSIEAQESESSHPESQTLFDGKSLEGWSGDERFWRIEDGAIVGQTTEAKPTDKNTFLIWGGGEVDDFEIRFKYKMAVGNSGIQIRSNVVEGFRVHGYQADFDGHNSYTGIWYDEGGDRGIMVPRCKKVTIDAEGKRAESHGDVDEETFLAAFESGTWNEVVVTARGNKLTYSNNGNISAVLVDNQRDHAKSTGIIALQLHAGPPMEIRFKDIELTVFDN